MTFRYSATLGGFDDTPFADFTRDKEVIAFREHFYAVNEVPHLTCVVHYQDAIVPAEALEAARAIAPRTTAPHGGARFERSAPSLAGPNRADRRDGAPDPCEGLSEPERALFNHLREWRSGRAHEEGIPAYMILSNRQLVEVVRKRPDSPTALGHVHGLGPSKVQKYGAQLLARLHGHPPLPRAPGPAPEHGPAQVQDVEPATAHDSALLPHLSAAPTSRVDAHAGDGPRVSAEPEHPTSSEVPPGAPAPLEPVAECGTGARLASEVAPDAPAPRESGHNTRPSASAAEAS